MISNLPTKPDSGGTPTMAIAATKNIAEVSFAPATCGCAVRSRFARPNRARSQIKNSAPAANVEWTM